MEKLSEKSARHTIFAFLFLFLICLFLFSLSVGRYSITISEIVQAFGSKFFSIDTNLSENVETVIFNVRFPRILGAIIVGAALSASGAAYQGIFKNPLVSPDIIGASAGAGFGAALAIIFSFSNVGIQLMAFVFGLVAVFITYLIGANLRKGDPTLSLILTGMVIGTLFSSFISLLKYIADPFEKLPAITFWLMGSLATMTMKDIYFIAMPVVFGWIILYLVRWRLNIMAFGDEEAQTLGINTKKLRFIVILSSTMLTASVVSISGMIGWVGLIIPHFARLLVGPNYKTLLPVSIILGAIFLLLVDTLARIILPTEIPLGILTSMLGAPIFIYLLSYSRRSWV